MILTIALGIVLAVLILRFWPWILAVLAIVVVVTVAGILIAVYWEKFLAAMAVLTFFATVTLALGLAESVVRARIQRGRWVPWLFRAEGRAWLNGPTFTRRKKP